MSFSTAQSQSGGMTLQSLLNEPKGKIEYHGGQSFLLHVFWEAPSMEAAEKVLDALGRCAAATHRDTPCVPTYFFRISQIAADLVQGQPRTVGEHPQLQAAFKKLQMGVPRAAVMADLKRRKIDPELLNADPGTTLPASMQRRPVMLECTELYLDQRSFYEHAGSRDYLDAYGEVMKPGLQNRHSTIRVGTPTKDIVEKILEPMLKEVVLPVQSGSHIWKRPETPPGAAVVLSADISGQSENIAKQIPQNLQQQSTSVLVFAHPLREDTVRLMCVLPTLQEEILQRLSSLPLVAVELHCGELQWDAVHDMLQRASMGDVCNVSTTHKGYLLHEKIASLVEI